MNREIKSNRVKNPGKRVILSGITVSLLVFSTLCQSQEVVTIATGQTLTPEEKSLEFEIDHSPFKNGDVLSIKLGEIVNKKNRAINISAYLDLINDSTQTHQIGQFSTFPSNRPGTFNLSTTHLSEIFLPAEPFKSSILRLELVIPDSVKDVSVTVDRIAFRKK